MGSPLPFARARNHPQADAVFLHSDASACHGNEEAQVKRLICVTGFGAGNSRGRGGFVYNLAFHLLLGSVYDDKDVQELIVRRSKLDWVIVRPVLLTDGPKSNVYISRADVADFLVKQIEDDAFLHKAPVLTS